MSTYEEYSLRGKARKAGKTCYEFLSFGENHCLETGSRYSTRLYGADVIYGLRHMGIATVVVPTPSTVRQVIKNVMDIAHIIGKMKRGLFNRKIHREIDEIKHLGESIPIEQRKTFSLYRLWMDIQEQAASLMICVKYM